MKAQIIAVAVACCTAGIIMAQAPTTAATAVIQAPPPGAGDRARAEKVRKQIPEVEGKLTKASPATKEAIATQIAALRLYAEEQENLATLRDSGAYKTDLDNALTAVSKAEIACKRATERVMALETADRLSVIDEQQMQKNWPDAQEELATYLATRKQAAAASSRLAGMLASGVSGEELDQARDEAIAAERASDIAEKRGSIVQRLKSDLLEAGKASNPEVARAQIGKADELRQKEVDLMAQRNDIEIHLRQIKRQQAEADRQVREALKPAPRQ